MTSTQYHDILSKPDSHPAASGTPTGATSDAAPSNSSPNGSGPNTPSPARQSNRQTASQIEADATMARLLASGLYKSPTSTQRCSARLKAAANKSGDPTSNPTGNTSQKGKLTMVARENQGHADPLVDGSGKSNTMGRNTSTASSMHARQGLEAKRDLANVSPDYDASLSRYLTRKGADWTREPPRGLLTASKDGFAPRLRNEENATKAYPTTKGPHSPTTKKHDEITANRRYMEGVMVTYCGPASTTVAIRGHSGQYPREEDQYRLRPIRPSHTPVSREDVREKIFESNRFEQDPEELYDDDEQAAIMDACSAAATRARNSNVPGINWVKPGQAGYQEQLETIKGATTLMDMSKGTFSSPQGASQQVALQQVTVQQVAPQQVAPAQFLDRLASAARYRQVENVIDPVTPPPRGQRRKLTREDLAQLQAVSEHIDTILAAAEDEDDDAGDGASDGGSDGKKSN